MHIGLVEAAVKLGTSKKGFRDLNIKGHEILVD